jgi:hypothetical protein
MDGGSAFAEPEACAILGEATLEQLEALGQFSYCREWRAAVLSRLSCHGVDEAELAQRPEEAWHSYYKRLEVCSILLWSNSPFAPFPALFVLNCVRT